MGLIMEVLFFLGCVCGALVIGFIIGMFFTGWLLGDDE
ncbi:hypothetical protein MODO_3153 [Myroides odoratimimus]|nr:hypothetical protein MODO_3153 [Myroides odoratimimus]STZ48156.1 Uncharacterised protein [Myroides odoratimimus]